MVSSSNWKRFNVGFSLICLTEWIQLTTSYTAYPQMLEWKSKEDWINGNDTNSKQNCLSCTLLFFRSFFLSVLVFLFRLFASSCIRPLIVNMPFAVCRWVYRDCIRQLINIKANMKFTEFLFSVYTDTIDGPSHHPILIVCSEWIENNQFNSNNFFWHFLQLNHFLL